MHNMKHSEETKRKISLRLKGIIKVNKGSFKEGHKPWNTGSKGVVKAWNKDLKGYKAGEAHWSFNKPRDIDTCHKISETLKSLNNRGENNPRWKGGYARKLFLNNQRRVMKLGNGGHHTFTEWENLKDQYNQACPSCSKSEPEIMLTEDHIIPLVLGGLDSIDNIQPLCKSCNCKKHTKVIKYA